MNRVIVTGATGFIGRQVIAPLVCRGFEVHAIYHTPLRDDVVANCHWHACNLFDERSVKSLLGKVRPTGLLHFAWDTTPGSYWTNSVNLTWTAITLHLLEAFQKNGGERLIIAGTSAEYDWNTDQPLDEYSSALKPQKLYGKCKNALREVIEEWATQENIAWAWGRIFNVFGPSEKRDRLVPKITRALLAGKEVELDGGAILRDFLHVADVGDAFAALFSSTVIGPVNIASGEAISIRSLAFTIAHQLGVPGRIMFNTLPNPRDEHSCVVASVLRLRKEVGWNTFKSLEERLRETCLWWSKHQRGATPMPLNDQEAQNEE